MDNQNQKNLSKSMAVVLLGAMIALLIKKPYKFSLFIFCLGFILINKFFEGMLVLINSSLF